LFNLLIRVGGIVDKHWKVLDEEVIFEQGYMKIRTEKCELPDGRIMPRYYIVDFFDWVQVVAVTAENKMVMVRQYRHAAREVCLELPGGAMSQNSNEVPEDAGRRELLEETGYDSDLPYKYLGFHYPNPALQSNKIHVFLAQNCEKKKDQDLDPFEDLSVEYHDVKQVYNMLDNGEFLHSLMVPSLVLARKYL